MRCSKCNALIPNGKVYCSVCGTEVRMVPDYNFLEDDMLSDIIQQGVRDSVSPKPKISKSQEEEEIPYTNKSLYVKIAVIVVALLVLVMLSLSLMQYNRIVKQENSYDYQCQQGEIYLSKQNYELAEKSFRRACELRPEDIYAPYAIIDLYLEQGMEEEALKMLYRRIEENLYEREAYERLIAIYDSRKDYNKIRELCENVRSSNLLEMFSDYLLEKPKFNRISGTYTVNQKITLHSSKGYDIYYTTDGSDPAESGRLYTGELNLKKGTSLVQAVTQSPKGIYSEVVKATYTIRD